MNQIHAGDLDVGYVDAGRVGAPVVILLHGWPYDIHNFDEVVPVLTASGYRVIVPHLRGYGTTRFLSASTPRNGQQAVIGVDTIALMDALKIERAILAGFDGDHRGDRAQSSSGSTERVRGGNRRGRPFGSLGAKQEGGPEPGR